MSTTNASIPWTPNSTKRRKVDEEEEGRHYNWTEGVIEEILVRLPTIKSILRMKSVCKNWYTLIRSRFFVDLHRQYRLLRHHEDHHNQLFYSWLGKGSFHVFAVDSSSSSLSQSPTPLFDVGLVFKAVKPHSRGQIRERIARFGYSHPLEPMEVYEPDIKVLGPLNNGIYCITAQVFVSFATNKTQTYSYFNSAFCNPATREFKLLSPPVLRIGEGKSILLSKLYYGFGSTHKPDNHLVLDYKMVVIVECKKTFRAFVYSLRRSAWVKICDSSLWTSTRNKALSALVNEENDELQLPTITQDFDFLPHAFFNGSSHWMANQSILQFHMANEVFGLIAGPPNDYPNLPHKRGIVVLNDHLAAIILVLGPGSDSHSHSQVNLDVWMMKEYGVEKSWTKIHCCMFQYVGKVEKFLGMFFSRDNSRHGITIERTFFQDGHGALFSYAGSGPTSAYTCEPCDSEPCWTTWDAGTRDSSWACWKNIGLSGYVETLEPVAIQLER